MRYRADITAGALKVPESRRVADLLLRGVDKTGWAKALYDQNVLQARSPETAERLALLIRGRLEMMRADLWRLVRDGTGTVATHAVWRRRSSTARCWATSSISSCGSSTRFFQSPVEDALGGLPRRLPGAGPGHAAVE